MGLADRHAVGLRAERRRLHDVRIRVLGRQPEKDGVVGTDGIDLSLLKHHETVGRVVHGP
jgi:hypothetical protein